ncbi:MAG: hypothetical protein ILP10_00305 [Lachnospiraceae bacterium]|nr:hypothetical protein [Lachnospiraceae bacterium]
MKLGVVTNVKDFMNLLFFGSVFDDYGLFEAEILTDCSLKVDGRRCGKFYDTGEVEEMRLPGYLKWSEKKNLILEAIKGKRLPVKMKIVLRAPSEDEGEAHDEEKDVSRYVNISFGAGRLSVTTGTAGGAFAGAKEAGEAWDEEFFSFLASRHIEAES